MKKIFTMLAIVALFATTMNAQWTNEGAWPDTSQIGATHGIAVDPDGKIWWNSYYRALDWIQGVDTTTEAGIVVYNADGTEASFSPIITISTGGGFVLDTIKHANSRGLSTDENGNIVYTRNGNVFKINYQTGEGISKADIGEDIGTSPTNAAVSDDGTVFIGPVAGGNIAMYDTDLSYIGNAVVGPPGIARTMQVSSDGNTIYWTTFTLGMMYIYNRADEFAEFALVDSVLEGMVTESTAWNKATGMLWLSNMGDNGSYTDLSWYAYNTETKTIVDSVKWVATGDSDEKPRGLDFSPDGKIAYLGTFANANERMQKAVLAAVSTTPVTFECDMSVMITDGNFDAGTGTVYVAGTLTDPEWGDGKVMLTDGDADQVYSATLNLNPGDAIEFKYLFEAGGVETWESTTNREYNVPVGAATYTAYFNDDDGRETVEITVAFQVNMEFEIVSSRFDPATDSVFATGSHNGWTTGTTQLTPSVGDPNVYTGEWPYESFADDVIYWKYTFINAGGTNWESNPPTGSGNYEHTVTADDITNLFSEVGLRFFNNATLETVTNNESVIRFIVDMNGATDGNGVAFPSNDNVVIAGASLPLKWPDGGWPDTDVDKVIMMVDDGTNGDETAGDNFWTMEVTFPVYGPFDIEYKYGANWGLASNNGVNDNEGGVGTNHHAILFSTFWKGDAVDVFGSFETNDVVNGIKELGNGIPEVYTLSQNYPNPFNPSTVINFSIPESGLVTLKIYNVLGQEVAELLNDVKPAGNYEYTFDASDLTSGMYVYTITSGSYTATRKMMLLK